MAGISATERLIKDYLLGRLAEAEMQVVEKRIMTDSAWFETLRRGEDGDHARSRNRYRIADQQDDLSESCQLLSRFIRSDCKSATVVINDCS
jgi:anti-sigma factor RsiW